jgi:ubiquitin related modifier 1
MLFANKRKHNITIPAKLDDGKRPNISYLIHHLVDHVMEDQRKELFILDGHV